jgi:hypothetical protein
MHFEIILYNEKLFTNVINHSLLLSSVGTDGKGELKDNGHLCVPALHASKTQKTMMR